MEMLGRLLMQQPLHILGVALVLGIAWLAITPRARSMLVAALAWLGYAVWEWFVLMQTPEANIRVDLLLLWPLLAILTLWALIRLILNLLNRRSPMHNISHTIFAFAATCLLSACAASAGRVQSMPLAGTQWQLVAIQSMDDAQGTTRIAHPERFTARFDADGRVSFQLDCNRGMATWKASPAADPSSGSIEFGPVAATRALCPPPHLDERVARDIAYMRGYLIKDGQLYLTLMADGGIYAWRPVQP